MTLTINGTTGLATDSTSAVVEAVSLNHPSSSTAAITLDASNNVTLASNLTMTGGIYLGGTGSANYLDDIETGIWTPTLNVGSVTIDHSAYVKVGNLVTITSDLTDITETTSTSDITVSGLPFASASQGRFVGSVMFRYVTAPSNAIQLVPYMGNSTNSFSFYWSFNDSSTWDGMQYANATQAWDIYFTLTYRAA